jgi:hypothetical protein
MLADGRMYADAMRRLVRVALAATLGFRVLIGWAQDIEQPRAKAANYPAHAELKALSIGADFLVHTFSGKGQSFFVPDYLVIEVAIYPVPGSRPLVAHSHFTLKINGKQPILPQPPQFVAASLKYEDWERRPTVVAEAGVGDAGVILGRRQPTSRFPGDRRPTQDRLPKPPRAPDSSSGVEKQEEVRAEEICVEQALPEGVAAGPWRGYIYFPHKGKVKDIKKLELVYSGLEGHTGTLKLR